MIQLLDENGELVKIPGTEHPSKYQLPVGALVPFMTAIKPASVTF